MVFEEFDELLTLNIRFSPSPSDSEISISLHVVRVFKDMPISIRRYKPEK
jgi:hypothetical protein